MGQMACPFAANKAMATSRLRPARRASGGNRTPLSPARPDATACRSTAITSAKSSCSASPAARRRLPRPNMQPMKAPFSSRFLRLLLAYTIGVNVFGLALGLSYVVATLLHLDTASIAGLIGGVASITLGVVAAWRTERALQRWSQ